MSRIIDQRGQLHECVSEDGFGCREYRLVENVPTFRFNNNLGYDLAITEDGRLYDTWDLKYIDIDESDFESIIDNKLALTNGGNLYSISKSDKFNIKLIDTDVKLVIRRLSTKFLYSKGDNQWYKYSGGQSIRSNQKLPHIDEIINTGYGCLITKSHIYIIKDSKTYKLRLIGKYLLSGVCYNRCSGHHEVLSIEVNEDGRLITSKIHDTRIKVANPLIEDMNRSSPWIGMGVVSGKNIIYNKDGYSFYVEDGFYIASTGIPPHILSTSLRLKNPMTKI